MTLEQLVAIFSGLDCHSVYVKRLALNDNSKNQPYFGGSFDVLNYLPGTEITTDNEGARKRESFKSKLNFFWVDEEGMRYKAPRAQLVLYPDYPEVRFSGFLLGCQKPPSHLYNGRIEGRILFLATNDRGEIYGYTSTVEEPVSREFLELDNLEQVGVFCKFNIQGMAIVLNARENLLRELRRIHNAGWIDSKRLTPALQMVDCSAPQCGGYTLEAELGIPSNSATAPDYLGWEIKQFSVLNFKNIGSRPITLMDHSPDIGYFRTRGAEEFLIRYGYADRRGREARTNFGGVHKFGLLQNLTSLRLVISGFDINQNKISDSHGYLALIDTDDQIAAGWSFTSIIQHWTKKHANACYVPSIMRNFATMNNSGKQYRFGDKVILGTSTDVSLFLGQIASGIVYYDPGIKLEMAIADVRKKSLKVRSLFRIKSGNLPRLYHTNEIANL